jgi:hypothetical protein
LQEDETIEEGEQMTVALREHLDESRLGSAFDAAILTFDESIEPVKGQGRPRGLSVDDGSPTEDDEENEEEIIVFKLPRVKSISRADHLAGSVRSSWAPPDRSPQRRRPLGGEVFSIK